MERNLDAVTTNAQQDQLAGEMDSLIAFVAVIAMGFYPTRLHPEFRYGTALAGSDLNTPVLRLKADPDLK
jgi:hypothetical protein